MRFKIDILQILVVAKRLKQTKKHIDIKKKYKEEMEGVNDMLGSYASKYKSKQLMAKVNFLNQAESFTLES